jgi:hypothetical protein
MSDDDVHSKLRPMVEETLRELHVKRQNGNEFIDMRIAQGLANKSLQLIDRFESLSEKHRILVIGAIRYFADSQDAVSEDGFATGLDDDVKIMNYVLEEIGDSDGFISSR